MKITSELFAAAALLPWALNPTIKHSPQYQPLGATNSSPAGETCPLDPGRINFYLEPNPDNPDQQILHTDFFGVRREYFSGLAKRVWGYLTETQTFPSPPNL